jgi:hypothetical protein
MDFPLQNYYMGNEILRILLHTRKIVQPGVDAWSAAIRYFLEHFLEAGEPLYSTRSLSQG